MDISAYITGIDSIRKDYQKWEADFFTALDAVLSGPRLSDALRKKLKEFVEKNVYDAYKPSVYPRRSEHPGYGVALNETDKNAMVVGFADALAGGGVVQMRYEPDGSHSGVFGNFYSGEKLGLIGADPNEPIKPSPVHGDSLIRRIETGEGYDWDVDVGPRPFWTSFVGWALDDDGLWEEIAEEMIARGFDITGGGTISSFDDGAI